MRKLQIILTIVFLSIFTNIYSQATVTDTINKNTDFDYLLKDYEVEETAKIFNDFDYCKTQLELSEQENQETKIKLETKEEQVKSLVKALYYSDTAIKKSQAEINVDNKINELQSKHISQIQTISDTYLKRVKSEKTKKNVYKVLFYTSVAYIGKLIFIK